MSFSLHELLEAGHVSLPFFVVLAFGAKMKESVSDSGGCQAGVWDKKAPHPGTTEPESEYIQRDRPGFIGSPASIQPEHGTPLCPWFVYQLGLNISPRKWLGGL